MCEKKTKRKCYHFMEIVSSFENRWRLQCKDESPTTALVPMYSKRPIKTNQRYMCYNTPLEPHHTHFILQNGRNVTSNFRLKCEWDSVFFFANLATFKSTPRSNFGAISQSMSEILLLLVFDNKPGMDMGWVNPWVGLGCVRIFQFVMGCVVLVQAMKIGVFYSDVIGVLIINYTHLLKFQTNATTWLFRSIRRVTWRYIHLRH